MKRKQKILSSVIMTLLGGSALSLSVSAAIIDLRGDATTAKDLATYASEISPSAGLTYKLPPILINLGGPVSTDTIAIPSAETRYARFTLENATIATTTPPLFSGATAAGGTAMTLISSEGPIASGTGDCPMLSEAAGQTSVTGVGTGNIDIADGGVGKNYVTFAIKSEGTNSDDKGGLLSAGCVVAADLQYIKVTNPGQPVKLTYGLFSGPIAAANNTLGDTGGMNKQGVTVVQFAPALVFKTSSAGKDAVPSVATQFKLFKEGATNTDNVTDKQKKASAGAFEFKVASPNVLDTNGTAISSLSTLLADTTKLKVEGDFSGIRATGTASAYYLSGSESCATPLSAAGTPEWGTNSASDLSSVPLSVSFALTDVTTTLSNPAMLYFCLGLGEKAPAVPFDSTTTSGVPILDSSSAFKVTLSPVPQTAYTITGKTEALKSIKRDGVTLEVPFINIAPGYSSRIMLAHYNKAAADDAKFFISIKGYDGEPQPTQLLKDGILKKGTTQKIMSTQLFTVPAGAKTHVGVSINFHAQNDDVQAVVQHINSTTGEVTSIPMTRPGGARGGNK